MDDGITWSERSGPVPRIKAERSRINVWTEKLRRRKGG